MIRETIKEAMKIRKVKSKDLAVNIGIAPATISRFLSGKTNLGQNKLESIFEILEIDIVIRK